jgi:hypothetical protein
MNRTIIVSNSFRFISDDVSVWTIRMTHKLGVVKDLEGSGHGLIEILSWKFPRRDWDNTRRISVRIVDFRDSKRAPREFKSRLLLTS